MKNKKKKLFSMINLFAFIFIFLTTTKFVSAAGCGEWAKNGNEVCNCPDASNQLTKRSYGGTTWWCCGTIDVQSGTSKCRNPKDVIEEQEKELEEQEKKAEENSVNIPEVNSGTLDFFNPLKNYSNKSAQLSTPGGILTAVLDFAFPIAGIILFLMILFGGFKMLTGATNESKLKEGQQMIVSAIVGFIILFAAYWIATLMEMIFGISILS